MSFLLLRSLDGSLFLSSCAPLYLSRSSLACPLLRYLPTSAYSHTHSGWRLLSSQCHSLLRIFSRLRLVSVLFLSLSLFLCLFLVLSSTPCLSFFVSTFFSDCLPLPRAVSPLFVSLGLSLVLCVLCLALVLYLRLSMCPSGLAIFLGLSLSFAVYSLPLCT